ncbi:SPRY domain, putative [Plasmodium vivax]|uniref:SPRY domain, putative n=1 Tax=Plasmodium vivax TaxID=5855 RepID=A0A564ZSE9_PLAVI|nr:SPRY domain, putative [Plasmodium vivax]
MTSLNNVEDEEDKNAANAEMDSPKGNGQVAVSTSYHNSDKDGAEKGQPFTQNGNAKNGANSACTPAAATAIAGANFEKKRKAEAVEERYQVDRTLDGMSSAPNVDKLDMMEKSSIGGMSKHAKTGDGGVSCADPIQRSSKGVDKLNVDTYMHAHIHTDTHAHNHAPTHAHARMGKCDTNTEFQSDDAANGKATPGDAKEEQRGVEEESSKTELAQSDTSKEEKAKDKPNEHAKMKNEAKERHAQLEANNKKKESYKYFIDYSKYRSKNNVTFSTKYKDSCVNLSSDKLTCYGDKGWSSVFVNNGADIGKWYYEIKIEEPVQNFHFLGYKDKVIKVNPYIRVGFACRYMRYDYPIGTDKYSYCVNSKNGRIFNNSISYDCMEPIKVGDIIGCYLNLKNKNTYNFDPRSDKKLYEYLQNGILCDPKDPPILKKNYGSSIFFSLNGQIKKNAFVDIYEGFYHPSVSLYMGASAKINLGPHFAYNHLNDYIPCVFMEPPIIL